MSARLVASFFAVVSFALTFVLATPASAAVVKDGDKFSVDTGTARICWVSPLSLRNADDCEGLTPDAMPEPPDGDARVIAMGLLRLEEPGEQPDIALVMVMHVNVPFTVEPDAQGAKDYAEGAQKAVAKELRKGATMRPPTNVRVVKASARQKHPLIRLVLDADGIPDGADDQLLEHHVHIAGIADDGVYSVAYLTKRRSARQVEAYADALGASFSMSKPAMSNERFEKKMEAIGSIVVLVLTLIIGGFISLVVVLSRRNKPAPYAYPHPYRAQSSYPPPVWHPASVQPQLPAPVAPPRREWWDELQ